MSVFYVVGMLLAVGFGLAAVEIHKEDPDNPWGLGLGLVALLLALMVGMTVMKVGGKL